MDWVDLEDEAEKGLYTSRYISLSHCPACCLFSHPRTHTYTADKERDQLRFEEEWEERRRPPRSPKKRARPVARDRPTAHKSNDRPVAHKSRGGRLTAQCKSSPWNDDYNSCTLFNVAMVTAANFFTCCCKCVYHVSALSGGEGWHSGTSNRVKLSWRTSNYCQIYWIIGIKIT